MLDGRDLTGLGLGAFKLIRLAAVGSAPIELGRAETTLDLPGLALAGFGFGAGASLMMVTTGGFTNMPLPISQSK